MSEEKVGSDEPAGSGETSAASIVPRIPDQRPQPVTPRASLDTRVFRRTMGLFASGVTVITARVNGSVRGITANSVTSVSLEPLLMQVAINRRAIMCNIIQQAGEFAINILSERQEDLSSHFAGAKAVPQPASLRFEPIPTACRTSTTRLQPFTAGSSGCSMAGTTSSCLAASSASRMARWPRRCSTSAAATARSVTWRRPARGLEPRSCARPLLDRWRA